METNITTAANRQHKDTVFRDLFGSEERKVNALSLYNALTGSSYTDTSVLELTTLKDVLYMNVKNDVSIFFDSRMMLWEHQSTRNPNMPLRGLVYLAQLYQSYVHKNHLDPYGSSQLELPTPYYCIFYNGDKEIEDYVVLRLSDSFKDKESPRRLLPAVEITATVFNINDGHNSELMGACQTLADYAHFMGLIRRYNKSMPLAEAIDVAMRQCIKEGVLADYLSSKRAEVAAMLITEFDQAEYEEILELEKRRIAEKAEAKGEAKGRLEGEAKGRAEGEAKGRASLLVELVRSGELGRGRAAELLGVDSHEFERLLEQQD
ncbi:MAG: hypothetical protein J6D34_01245 [Atopobiaceae bacterium]|nr:hypothetical protein [Atopobiaceae bacterium]